MKKKQEEKTIEIAKTTEEKKYFLKKNINVLGKKMYLAGEITKEESEYLSSLNKNFKALIEVK